MPNNPDVSFNSKSHRSTAPGATPATLQGSPSPITIELVAAVFSVANTDPAVLAIQGSDKRWSLPSVAFEPTNGDSLDGALRDGLRTVAGVNIGHVEQLGAAALAPLADGAGDGAHNPTRRLMISYLALAANDPARARADLGGRAKWLPLYGLLPWEDWRHGRPAAITTTIEPRLQQWAELAPDKQQARIDRVQLCFGTCQGGWDEEKVNERLELLCAADLLHDVARQHAGDPNADGAASPLLPWNEAHVGYLAAALGSLRGKIKVKPIVFELVPERFTLYELQQTVEAILGPPLHKQNFRRLVEHMGLVEPTGEIKSHTGGRPAQLFRFRPSVVLEHVHPGLRVRGVRT